MEQVRNKWRDGVSAVIAPSTRLVQLAPEELHVLFSSAVLAASSLSHLRRIAFPPACQRQIHRLALLQANLLPPGNKAGLCGKLIKYPGFTR